jgi:hypothetical protein
VRLGLLGQGRDAPGDLARIHTPQGAQETEGAGAAQERSRPGPLEIVDPSILHVLQGPLKDGAHQALLWLQLVEWLDASWPAVA